jgi:hypothetical protein
MSEVCSKSVSPKELKRDFIPRPWIARPTIKTFGLYSSIADPELARNRHFSLNYP